MQQPDTNLFSLHNTLDFAQLSNGGDWDKICQAAQFPGVRAPRTSRMSSSSIFAFLSPPPFVFWPYDTSLLNNSHPNIRPRRLPTVMRNVPIALANPGDLNPTWHTASYRLISVVVGGNGHYFELKQPQTGSWIQADGWLMQNKQSCNDIHACHLQNIAPPGQQYNGRWVGTTFALVSCTRGSAPDWSLPQPITATIIPRAPSPSKTPSISHMLIDEDDEIEDNMIEDNDGDNDHMNHPPTSSIPPISHMLIDEDDEIEDNMIEDNDGDNDHQSHLHTSPAPVIPPIESRSPPIPSQLPWPVDPPYRDALQ